MKTFPAQIPVPLTVLAALLLPVGIAFIAAGCGGGGSGGGNPGSGVPVVVAPTTAAPTVATPTARATVSIEWPARSEDTRLVPIASNSVRVTITNATGFRVSQVIARPATGAAFDNLPPGALTVTATAHADATGDAQPPQASGTQIAQAVAEQTFALNLTMNSTIDRLALTQSASGVGVGQTATFAASALDAAGNLILTGATTWRWGISPASVAAVVPGGASLTVTGTAPGTASVTVTETESGKTATLPLTVSAAPSPTPSPLPTPTPTPTATPIPSPTPTATPDPFAGVREYTNIDVNNLPDYANPAFPAHYDNAVRKQDNTPVDNPVTDRGATLGRVLFFDKRLSINDTTACSSCHQQSNGFVDPARFSRGFNGTAFTDAHSMRLANLRFYAGRAMFWDKRAASVEAQATQPIQNEVEMGFDAAHGGFGAVTAKMGTLPYYPELFRWVYGDPAITEDRIQRALAQYERSIVSVNSRFDTEFARVFNPALPQRGLETRFPGYTAQEERGKVLFTTGPGQGGAGCNSCHQAPTFALAPTSLSNGLDAGESRIFKSPSLKNVALTGPYMHDGRFATLEQAVDHYIRGVQNGPALDNRLKNPQGQPQRLPLTVADRDALVAFLRTLNDGTLTADPKFTNPLVK